ncbi:unnamed protein product [Ambrosiozyma monospora]|uniref:Unnamed protein product n=1 Tax=Ambrosiozyma monospora TaxID=43982 RepID=A0ACB5T647_AMBMO|nr:unnamed protein product [Ambrosiozyma monospora]
MESVSFNYGFAQALVQKSKGDQTDENLRILVQPDDCPNCLSNDTWDFELGVSQSNAVFKWSDSQAVQIKDADHESAVFSAADDTLGNTTYVYSLYVFDSGNGPKEALNSSWCAVKEFKETVAVYDITSNSTTGEGNFFAVEDLNRNTSYSAVLLGTNPSAAYGGTVYKKFSFDTTDSDACKVVYGLDFCSDVAYAVPASSDYVAGSQSFDDLIAAYDNYSMSAYTNFSYALQQVACDTVLDARYSPIRTCDDCRKSYKDWLCSVSIPRCSTEERETYKHYNASEGRNDFIKDVINPPSDYYEIMPCISSCYFIARDCPADFGFSCPEDDNFVKLSYSDEKYRSDNSTDFLICNAYGNVTTKSFGVRVVPDNALIWMAWIVIYVMFINPLDF